MENFSLFYSNEEDAMLSNADIRNFQNTWNIVDVNQRGMIPVSCFKFIVKLLLFTIVLYNAKKERFYENKLNVFLHCLLGTTSKIHITSTERSIRSGSPERSTFVQTHVL